MMSWVALDRIVEQEIDSDDRPRRHDLGTGHLVPVALDQPAQREQPRDRRDLRTLVRQIPCGANERLRSHGANPPASASASWYRLAALATVNHWPGYGYRGS